MSFFSLLLPIFVMGLIIYWFLRRRMNFFKELGLPHIPPFPIVGNMGPALFRLQHISKLIQEAYDLNPEAKYVGFYDFMSPVFVIRDPELIKTIAVKHFDSFPDHRGFIDEVSDPLFGKNLFSIRGDKWREVRNLLSPAFTSSKMKAMFQLMTDCAENFANFVEESSERETVVQMKDIFTRYTNDVIATCAFGISIDSMRNPKNDFYLLGKEATNMEGILSLKFFVWRVFPSVMKLLNVKIVTDRVASFFKGVIGNTIDVRDKKGISRPDMLQLMMDARGKTSQNFQLTIEEMTAQAFIFFFGGFDTSSTLMAFLAHEIAVNPDIQSKLQKEIDAVLKEVDGKPTYDAINGMPYLDATINEANRRHAQVSFLDRLCDKEFELPPALPGMKPVILKPGTNVWFPACAIHCDPKYYENPMKFDPERFLLKKSTTSQVTNLTFGLGPRMCIGNRFALLETKVLFFHLLAKCHLKPCAKTGIPLKLSKKSFASMAEGGFWLAIEPRKKGR